MINYTPKPHTCRSLTGYLNQSLVLSNLFKRRNSDTQIQMNAKTISHLFLLRSINNKTKIISCDWEIFENRNRLACFWLLTAWLNDPIHVVPLPGRLPFTKIPKPRLHFMFCGYGLVLRRIVIQRHKPKNRSSVRCLIPNQSRPSSVIMNFNATLLLLYLLLTAYSSRSTEHGIHPETPSESIIVTAMACLLHADLMNRKMRRRTRRETYKEPYNKKSITKSTCPLRDVIRTAEHLSLVG